MVALNSAKLSAVAHGAATDTALAVWTTKPGAPSTLGITEARLIAYLSATGAVSLLVADAAADVWREVVGAPY